ncbi:hypothetical protein N2152v2_006809 [Parachlorella kessleri]
MAPKSAGSVSSYGQSSEASSANGSDASVGVVRGNEGTGGDLLSRGNGSRKEAFFSVLYFIFSGRLLETDWRFLLLSTLFVWAQTLNFLFGPNFFGWDIDWDGNRWWRFYKRLLLSNAAMERGWGVYVGVLLVFIIASMLTTAIPAWLNFYMKSRTKFRWKWPGHLLRICVSIVRVFYISTVSLLTVSFTCNNDSDRTMFYFPDKGCLFMPQAILFIVCLVVELVLLYPALLWVLVECGDTSYYSHNLSSTSVGSYLMRLSVVRMLLPLVPMAFQLFPKWQAFFNFLLTSYYLYITIRRAPMHRTWLNCVSAFLALFPCWAASLAFIGVFYPQYWPRLTTAFLAGMFPLGFACAGITYWRLRFIWDVAELFKGWTPRTPRRDTYRFWDEYEVEMVARVCRKTVKTDQLDIIPDPYYTALSDKVVQAGLLQFPNSAFLNIVYASLQAVLLNDPSGGMTELQKAKKCGDFTWVQRFQVYVREQEKLSQKGRDSDQSVTFDAATWTEFSVNYKAAIRSHRNALSSLKAFWRLLLRTDVSMLSIVHHFLRIPASKDAAERSYKAFMERYPNNPRVLRVYSRFLQQVKNDPQGASRYASLANKVEEQQEESWREVVFSQLIDCKLLDEKSTRTIAMIDETMDAVVMINSDGMIQHINQPALKLFGYRKGELEGANVSQLMPDPFSHQHDSFLRNYMTTRTPHILNSTREVVGVHKTSGVIPIDLVVTPLKMGAAECFLGVIKPLDDESTAATAYCTPSGVVVCINRGFSNLLAHQSVDVIGCSFAELTTMPEKASQIIEEVSGGDGKTHSFGSLVLTHKFGEELSMKVVGRRAGTENVGICVLEMSNEGNAFTGLITVNKATGRITYANVSFCEFVGIPADQLIKMRLHETMSEPYAMLHQRWLKGRDLSHASGLRCRTGRAVDFKHGSSGKAVTALLEIAERSTDQGNVFNVKVAPVTETVDREWNRVSLTVAQDGIITGHTGRLALFGLEKEALVAKGMDALLDAYRKEGEVLVATHARLMHDLRDRPRTLRVAVAPRGKRTVPAVLEVVLPGEEHNGQEAPATMHLYRADCLEGVVELDAASKVKRVNDEAALLFGIPASSLVGESIQKVLPKACPGGRTSELLAAHGQRGGSKQKVGALQAADGVHPDKHPLYLSLQAAESIERPGRYLVRLIVPKPVSAYSTINRPGTKAPEVLTAAAEPAQPGIAGSLHSFFTGGANASRPGTGGACPFHFGAAAAVPAVTGPGGEAGIDAMTINGGHPGSGSKEASPTAAGLRPVTGGSPCPINLNTEEVLSSLSFPPSSRFVIEKALREDQDRPGTAHTDTTALAAAVAAAAVDATVAAADGVAVQTQRHDREQGPVQADVPTQGQSALHSMTASEEEEGEGVPDEEMDPAELASKLDGVRAWLDGTNGLTQEQEVAGGPEGAVPRNTGAAAPELQAMENSGPGLVAVTQEPGGAASSAGAGSLAPLLSGDRGIVDSSSMGGSDTESLAASEAAGADYSRLKRYKKAYKLLNSSRARQAINRLRIHLRLVLLVLVGAHIAFFAAALVTVNSSTGYIDNIGKAGMAASVCPAALSLMVVMYASQEILTYGHVVTQPDPQVVAAQLLEKALVLEATQNEIYFSKGSAAAATTAAYDGTMYNASVYLDVQPTPMTVKTPMSLWDGTQRLVNAFKDVAAMTQQQWYTLNTTFSYRFAMDNSPSISGLSQSLLNIVDLELSLAVNKLQQVGKITWILLGLEAGLVVPLCTLYVLRLLYQVAIERFNLFSIFLFIPRPALLALARAEIVVDELDDSDDDEKEMGAGMDSGGNSGAIATGINSKAAAQKAAQSRWTITRRPILWLMLPFVVWLVAIIVLWVVQGSYLCCKVKNAYPNLPFRGTLFSSVPQNKLLFNEQCLRANQSDCSTKDNPYYWTANMGLNTLTYYYIEQGQVLSNASTTDINVNHPAGTIQDIDGGWTSQTQIFTYMANFAVVRAVQAVVLAFVLAGSLAYLYFLAAPFIGTTLLEARKVAEVLSYLPQGVDLASLLEVASVSSGGGKGGGTRRTSTQSVEEELDE